MSKIKTVIIIIVASMIFVGATAMVFINSNNRNETNTSTQDEIIVSSVDEVSTVDEITTATETTVEATEVEIVTEVVTTNDTATKKPSNNNNNNNTTNVNNNTTNNNNTTSGKYSEYEIDLLARTIYQEGGICSEYCQWLIGSTVLNLADERGGIENVVFDYNTFNVAYVLYNATPSDLSYSVARRLANGDRDYNVKAFRTDYYHSFGTPYTAVDNVYFSSY